MTTQKKVFKVYFFHMDKVYTLFAKEVNASGELYNMCEISDIIFQRNKNLIVPSEDEVRQEFSNIKKLLIPLHHLIRIDELEDIDEDEITNPKAHKTDSQTANNLIRPVEFFGRR